MKTPAFTLNGFTIIETKTGYIGQIVQNKNGYAVTVSPLHELPLNKKRALEARMRNWYYYSQVKQSQK